VLPRSTANVRAWVHDAQSIKPGNLMPSFADTFTDEQLDDLVAYLDSLE
jgi:cytochrome c1